MIRLTAPPVALMVLFRHSFHGFISSHLIKARVAMFFKAVRQHRKRLNAPQHAVVHLHRGIGLRFAGLLNSGRGAWMAFLAVLGPGLLAGLSDDDPAGITTYSVLGRGFWLRDAVDHPDLDGAAGAVPSNGRAHRCGGGQRLCGQAREKWGRGAGYFAVGGLLFANVGTICAEYAGISAAGGLVGIPSWISVPVAGVLISLVVVLGPFHRVERVLLVISATLALYIGDGFLAAPDWHAVWHHAVVLHLPTHAAGWIAIAAALGTTLAPCGLACIQSYAVDKKITLETLRWARWDVAIGSVRTGVIGLAIAVACAATPAPGGRSY